MKKREKEFVKVRISYLEALLEVKEEVLKNIEEDAFIDNLQKASILLGIARFEGTINYAKTLIKYGERVE